MLMKVAQMSAATDTISSLFVVEVCCSRFSRRRAQDPGVFGCWLGSSGAIAGAAEVVGFSCEVVVFSDEVVGFSDDMLSALFLAEDCACGDSSLGLSSLVLSGGMEVSDMEKSKRGMRK